MKLSQNKKDQKDVPIVVRILWALVSGFIKSFFQSILFFGYFVAWFWEGFKRDPHWFDLISGPLSMLAVGLIVYRGKAIIAALKNNNT